MIWKSWKITEQCRHSHQKFTSSSDGLGLRPRQEAEDECTSGPLHCVPARTNSHVCLFLAVDFWNLLLYHLENGLLLSLKAALKPDVEETWQASVYALEREIPHAGKNAELVFSVKKPEKLQPEEKNTFIVFYCCRQSVKSPFLGPENESRLYTLNSFRHFTFLKIFAFDHRVILSLVLFSERASEKAQPFA